MPTDDIDSGNVPAFAIYLASIWKCFGRTLFTSHLAMLPFVIGIVWQLSALCKRFIASPFTKIAWVLLLSDTTLLSQMTLVSPDIPLLFFFLLALNAVLDNHQKRLAVAIFFLFLVHTRGIMLGFSLFLLDTFLRIEARQPSTGKLTQLLRRAWIYLPGLLLFVAYNYYHYLEKGWVFTHEDSPWKATQDTVDLKGFCINIITLVWRLVDYGKVIIWLIAFLLVLRFKKQVANIPKTRLLFFLAVALLVFSHIDFLWAKSLLAHRYFMPFNLVFGLLTATILFNSDGLSKQFKYTTALLWLAVILSGSFWIYPTRLSQGWDSTLAHLPYYELRQEALHYLDQKQIPYTDVETFFPNTAPLNLIDLNNDPRQMDTFDGSKTYVFFSNVYNVEDTTLDILLDPSRYKPIQQFEHNRVFITIYQRL